MPHGYSYLWNPSLVWLHVLSDSSIALAYFSVPVTLVYFIYKHRYLAFQWMFLCFGVFILARCATHVMEVWTPWHATYWLSCCIKAVTAVASLLTAFLFVQLLPKALALPSLEAIRLEIAERRGAEGAQNKAKSELEQRVQERTVELSQANEDLLLEIAQRTRIGQTLRDSEERLRLVQELSGLGLWDWYPSEDLVVWSDEHFGIFGIEPGSRTFDSATFSALVYPDDRAAFESVMRHALRAGGELETEYRIRRPDGQVRWVISKGQTHCNDDGEPIRMIGVTLDLTERKQAAEALRRSEQRFRSLVERVKDYAIFMLNPEGMVTSWNAGAEKIKGYSTEEIIGQHFSRFYSAEDLREDKPMTDLRIAATQGRFEEEGWRIRKDGSRFRANVVITALFDQHGILIGFTRIVRDLTASGRAEEAIQAARAELARVARVTTVGELTASIAHEINQPLSAIVNNANASRRLLDMKPPDLEEVRQALVEIAEAGTRASELISRIRALMKKSVPEKTRLDMNQIIRDVFDLIPSELQRHEVSSRTELMAVPPVVLGDRIQLQQVVLNLIINGIEAMTSIVDRPRILLIRSKAQETGELLVAVEDSGTGLDPRNVDHLFDAFFTTKTDGLGLGLSISLSIIEAHNGRLWASQNDTHGATFQFTLPTSR
jgi:PAS domain S-box-containing protein